MGKVAFEDFGRERGLERALGTGGRNQAFLKTELDDFGRGRGAFSGNFLNAGARDFAFVHQSADDANEFYTVPLPMWNVCPARAGEAPSLSVIGRRPFGEIPKITPKIIIAYVQAARTVFNPFSNRIVAGSGWPAKNLCRASRKIWGSAATLANRVIDERNFRSSG